ncbi:MAG: FMN-binding negative transcriptional regulator [Terracidiphilus sp.]|jgi:transcriptional regulator
MFVRPCWQPTSPQDPLEIIEQYPWALLVSNGDDGPLATNLPLLIESSNMPCREAHDEPEASLVLVGHLARANEHARHLANAAVPFLAIFEGPWSYVTASWYPGRDMPSTYYYTAVHCYGTVELQDEPALDASVEKLTRQMESSYPDGWRTDEVPREAITRRFAGIIGFRMHVTKLEAKFKLGQDEPLRDALAVADVLETHEAAEDRLLAGLIRKHNLARAS